MTKPIDTYKVRTDALLDERDDGDVIFMLCGEIDRLRREQQTPPQGKTVEVRVAVAVDPSGHWSAAGWQGAHDSTVKDAASEMVADDETIYWLTATLPVPTEAEVVAKMEVE